MITDLVPQILEKYNFNKVEILKEIKGGVFNQHFLIQTNKGKYVLRLSNKTRTFFEVNFEIDLINHIHGLQVLKFIKNNNNQIVTIIDNRIIVITEYNIGKIPTKITNNLLKQTGEFLGKYHSRCNTFNSIFKRNSVYYF